MLRLDLVIFPKLTRSSCVICNFHFSAGPADRKRDGISSMLSAQTAARKVKPGLSGGLTALGRPAVKLVDTAPTANLNRPEPWEEVAIEVCVLHYILYFQTCCEHPSSKILQVEPVDILNAISEAESNEDEEKIEWILCGAVKQLRAACLNQRVKIDQVLALELLYLSKWRPQYFNTELIVEALLVLLRRDPSPTPVPFKGKNAVTSAAVLACNLLLAAFHDERNWPESFIKVFIDDSLGERLWVDREECQGFVENILTGFNTKLAPRNILQHENFGAAPATGGAASSPNVASLASAGIDEEASVDSDVSQNAPVRGSANVEQQVSANVHSPFPRESNLVIRIFQNQVQVIPRYLALQETIETLVLDVVKEQMSRSIILVV